MNMAKANPCQLQILVL